MHRLIITSLLVILSFENTSSQSQHLGVWNGMDEAGNPFFFEFTPDNKLITFQVHGADTLFGKEARYSTDYSKNPVWLDMSVLAGDMEVELTAKSLVRLASDSEMILIRGKDPNVRPAAFSLDVKENYAVLHKLNGATRISEPAKSVLFDSTFVDEALKQCSREVPQIEGKWNPSQADIDEMESDMGAIADLTSEGCCYSGVQIHNPKFYCRQYVGVVVNGRRMIYVNAFSPDNIDARNPAKIGYWRKHIEVICDGGKDAWGCLYNVRTHQFSQLSVNGSRNE